ncbi:hypothetical protein [Nocardiopsis sp. CNR-923]|uniref:hypothetical protein n=1 Tax=Nocardiopsis sp. CNR-923 TaxID=1904965 RepID=UPI00117DC4B1|nr:hypothetical protein [Nocardiopsis sp. CNR-923]
MAGQPPQGASGGQPGNAPRRSRWGRRKKSGGGDQQPPQRPHPPPEATRRRKGGCGCGCTTFLLILAALGVLAYLQLGGAYDWMYRVFAVGFPGQFVWF